MALAGRPEDASSPLLLFTVSGRVQPAFTTPPSTASTPSSSASPPPTDSLDVAATLLRRDAWTVPVVALATANIVAMLAFEVYVLVQMARARASGTRRHLMLGQLLLLGLAVCTVTGALYTLQLPAASCRLLVVAAGCGYTLVLASLFVKCVFLHSLDAGVYLPAGYQALLLLFVCAVQLAIEAQWLLTHTLLPQHGEQVTDGDGGVRFELHLLTLTYPAMLLGAVTAAAVRARRIQQNHGEAVYICAACVVMLMVTACWTVGGVITVRRQHQDAAASLGLVVTATLVFLIMFMSKGRQLAAVGKTSDGLAGCRRDDDEDDPVSFSYLADPLRYSPGLQHHHVRPVKVEPAADLWRKHPLLQPAQLNSPYVIPRCSGYIRQEDNTYNTIDHLKSRCRAGAVADRAVPRSSNPNVFFYRPPFNSGMLY